MVTMSEAKDKLIVALDVKTMDEAKALVKTLSNNVDIYKVGSQLFTASGPQIVHFLAKEGKKVFLDLKFHDIPNTVANAVSAVVGLSDNDSLMMLTVHTQGGYEMLKTALEAATKQAQANGVKRPLIVGITVLTSEQKVDNIQDLVLQRAELAKQCGLDGVVLSSQEAAFIRDKLGNDFIIVTPGIRPAGETDGDQKRVTTPQEAIKNGSDYLVIGRPIVKAKDPLSAAQAILQEINNAIT